MIGQIISHYRILALIGEGGMGTVYLAEDIVLGRRVAIKFLTIAPGKQHYRARFLREARSVSALSHPNIATVYDYGETRDNIPFIVMELIEGQTLHDLMKASAMTIMRILEIIEEVAKGLAEAHRRDIIHRDIKPTNVSINERGEVKVLDFGLAKQLNDDTGDTSGDRTDIQALLATQTREGIIVGTPMYLSPEQALGAPVDARSDIFSLGSVLYECISGRPAFQGRSPADVCARVIRDDPPAPSSLNPDVPPELDRVTLKALAKKGEERYQSAKEFLTDLRQVRESLWDAKPTPVRHVPPKKGVSRKSILTTLSDGLRRPRVLVGVFFMSLILALLVVWAVTYWRQGATTASPVPAEALQWYGIGTSALRDGTYDKAVKAFKKAISIEENFPLAHARLAEALTELENTDAAKSELLRLTLPLSERTALSLLEALYLQAIHLSLTGDSKGAIETYLKIVEQSPEGERAAAHVDLGRAYERDGDSKRAIQSYLAALKLDPQYSAAAIRAGVLYGRRLGDDNTQTALSHFQIAETRFQTLNDAEGLAEVSYQRGVMYMTQRKLDLARAHLIQSISKAAAIDNKYQQFKARMHLSSVACLEGITQEAERYASEALEFAKANGLENLTANGLITLGNAFQARTELAQAQKYLDRALEVAQLYKLRRTEARVLLSLGSIATQHHSKPEVVRAYVERALTLIQQEGSRRYAMQAQQLLGHASEQQGDYLYARKAFEQQLLLARHLDDPEQTARAHEGLGIALAHQEEFAGALENFNQYHIISKQLKNEVYVKHALLNYGNVLWRVGRYDEAEKALAEVLQLAAKADKPDAEFLARLHLVNAQRALSQRRFGAAIADVQKALRLSQGEDETTVVEATYAMGLARALSGDAVAGQQLCGHALADALRLNSPRLISDARLALATARLEAGDSSGALESAMEAHKRFSSAGQHDSEWRALLIAALASKRLSDESAARTYAERAAGSLAGLRERLGESYQSYLNRPDIQYARDQLRREFALNV